MGIAFFFQEFFCWFLISRFATVPGLFLRGFLGFFSTAGGFELSFAGVLSAADFTGGGGGPGLDTEALPTALPRDCCRVAAVVLVLAMF